MTELPLPIRPDIWLAHVFLSRAAAQGGVVRRRTRDIERIVGRERFLAELERRGFRAVENAGQTIIFCNRDPVRIVR
ncbi:N-(5'-phosphoribosyl)anthranilate isomerase [Salipiger mangrovisoli]|uniref:N-(5'-phosphoribosyl)anthranilate isomerase n=1 Tax=Salipiger mangrovisoli TaxID=2865933 RepID=A0ABR9WX21_9RHOB|nr:N-(5'-phosphoribosyl)anthranilate isomerase [Salipiger mangrovisoli]MBE9635829.1 N-(5'-phosphoribosyl)anthranilate isomerase [Salipiger mangrovisoli]